MGRDFEIDFKPARMTRPWRCLLVEAKPFGVFSDFSPHPYDCSATTSPIRPLGFNSVIDSRSMVR